MINTWNLKVLNDFKCPTSPAKGEITFIPERWTSLTWHSILSESAHFTVKQFQFLAYSSNVEPKIAFSKLSLIGLVLFLPSGDKKI